MMAGEDVDLLLGPPATNSNPIFIFFENARSVFKRDDLGMEILQIAFPAALALAADPIASLIDTAFLGHLGPIELAAVGVAIAVFNQASKVTIFPLVSITTSFVAEEDTVTRIKNPSLNESKTNRRIPSASTALALAALLGLFQAIFLVFLAEPILGLMGVKPGSPMLAPAHKYLTIRSLGAPAVVLSLAMQGVFRGLKDTKTPLYATVAGDSMSIVLDPILIFVCRLGVTGAAISHVLSQYLIFVVLLIKLMKQVDVSPHTIQDLQISRFLKNGSLLLARVTAVTICVTLAASMAARLGPSPMAAFQICLQVWMTSSLLADGLAVAGQAILAGAFAEKDYRKATEAAARVLQMGFVLGLGLAALVGILGRQKCGPSDRHRSTATQPITSLAFVFDGVNFGASDFAYSAYSMVLVSIVSIASLFVLAKTNGFIGIWLALTIYMGLRTFAGFWRMGTGTGPWQFLKQRSFSISATHILEMSLMNDDFL